MQGNCSLIKAKNSHNPFKIVQFFIFNYKVALSQICGKSSKPEDKEKINESVIKYEEEKNLFQMIEK